MNQDKTVQLSLSTIIRECSLNPNLKQDHFIHFGLRNRENIHDVFHYKKFNDDFVNTVTCYQKDDALVGIIRPSYDEFLLKLAYLLNIPGKGNLVDDESLTKRLQFQLEKLRNVKSEAELKRDFPLIYRDLVNGRKYYDDLQKLKNQENVREQKYIDGEHYFYSCALKKSLPNFIKTQSVFYERLIQKRKEYQEKVECTSFNGYLKKHFDLDKITMYVMHEYLSACEASKDQELIQKYVSIVERYVASDKRKDFSLIADHGVVINYNMILNRLHNLQRLLNDKSSLVEWVLIPEGRDYTHAKKEHEARTTLLDFEEMQRLESLGTRKNVFYESTPYVAKIIGLKRYRGYIGYVYENGEILLDREYNPSNPQSASGDAIYHLRIEDFETLSKCDKQVLRKHPKVSRMNHSPTWEERAKLIIDYPATEEDKEDVKQFIKRLKEKRD